MPEEPEDLALVGQLVGRSQTGDTMAFGELVSRYRNRVYAIAFNMTRSEEDAWDVAQEAFVKAWKSIGHFRGQSSFFTWLYRIVMNVTIDFQRKRKIEAGTEFDDQVGHQIDPAATTVPSATARPDRSAHGSELRAEIDAALLKLSGEHREVIVLREIEGLDYQEIADRLELQIGTVMSRLFYARKKLQTLLKEVYEQL